MSKQANKTVIGIFVVGAIALVVVAVVVWVREIFQADT